MNVQAVATHATLGTTEVDRTILEGIFRRAAWSSFTMVLLTVVIGKYTLLGSNTSDIQLLSPVPIPMFFSHYVLSEKFYTFWIVCTMYVSDVLSRILRTLTNFD